jgi:hypothetical protein
MDAVELVGLGVLVACAFGMWRQLRRVGNLVETALGHDPQLEALAKDVAAIRYQLKNLRRDVKQTLGDGKAEGDNGEAK